MTLVQRGLFFLRDLSSVSKEDFEDRTLRAIDDLNTRLPEKLRLPVLCLIWHGLFHAYLMTILLFSGGLYIKKMLQPKWDNTTAIREKLILWVLIFYHAVTTFCLMPLSVTEEELVEGLHTISENTSSLKTMDMFDYLTEDDFALQEEAFLKDLDSTLRDVLDEDADLTFRE